jgi:hypothetical protein
MAEARGMSYRAADRASPRLGAGCRTRHDGAPPSRRLVSRYCIASMFVQYSVVSPRLRTFTTPEKMPVSVR